MTTAEDRVAEYQKTEKLIELSNAKLLESGAAEITAATRKWEQAKTNLASVTKDLKRLNEQKIQDAPDAPKQVQLKRNSLEARVKLAEAAVMKAFDSVRVKEDEREATRAEGKVRLQQAKTKTSDAKADVQTAKAALAKLQTQIIEFNSKIEENSADLQRSRNRLGHLERMHIVAPVDGTITQLIDLRAGTRVCKEGDVICMITPDEKETLNSPTEETQRDIESE